VLVALFAVDPRVDRKKIQMFKGLGKVYKAQKAKSTTASYHTGQTAGHSHFLQNSLQTNHKSDANRSPEHWQKVRLPSGPLARPQGTHTNHAAERYEAFVLPACPLA
jgi:hypothetical protein